MSCQRHTAPDRQRSGVLVSTPFEGGPVRQQDTVSCIHCSYSWLFQPGSGRKRGFCLRCMGITCGHAACEQRGCVHRERELEALEKGIPWEQISEGSFPTVVSVPGGVPCPSNPPASGSTASTTPRILLG